ncbi:MAG: F0F1 ATP synthase subunit A [Microgenomates group bacterium]
MAASLHISISAEPLFTFGGIEFSNSMFTSLIVSGLIILFAILVRISLTNTTKPTGLQNFAEWLIESLHNLVHGVTGDLKKTRAFFPFIATFFIFILMNNYFGLLPGVGTITYTKPHETETNAHALGDITFIDELTPSVHAAETISADAVTDNHAKEGEVAVPVFRPGTADLNTTLALALFSVLVTQVLGVQFQQLGYFKKFINFSSPIMFFVGILELISEFAKIISFAFRLFGNIFAGEVLLTVMLFLLPLVAPMPFYGLELFVGFIQSLVFAMLSLVFFNMATVGHEDH